MDYSSLDNHIELFDDLLGPDQAKNRETRIDYRVGRDSRPDSLRPGREFYQVEITTRNANFNPVKFSWFYHSVPDRSGWFITSLSFRGMGLNYLDFTVLDKLTKLEYLDLQGNELSRFPKSQLTSKENLHTLNLSANKLRKFDVSTDKLYPSLRILNLHNNRLNSINTSVFGENHELNRIILSHNNFQVINLDPISELSNLFTIDLSNNSITHFHEKLHNRRLTSLLLHNNRIKEFSLHGFLPSLKYLSLYENRIGSLNLDKFIDIFPNIKRIHLWGNKLSKIILRQPGYKELEEIMVSGNRLNEIKLQKSMKSLIKLDVSYNQLESVNLTELPQNLELLDISYNPIKHIEIPEKNYLDKIDVTGSLLDEIELDQSKISRINQYDNDNLEIAYSDTMIKIPSTCKISKI